MTQLTRDRAAVILAAGKGTRMKSSLPKVMHPVAGRPMVDWSVDLAQRAGCSRIVVIAHPSQQVLVDHVAGLPGDIQVAFQDPPMGTGHAVGCAESALGDFHGDLVVLYGDSPLIPATAIEDLFASLDKGAAIGVLGFDAAEPGLYGRLITSHTGELEGIVEAREASPEELKIRLCNSGVMAGRAETMFRLLKNISNDNAKGEFYLTDLVGLARGEGRICRAVRCAEDDLIGCDSKADLARAEAIYQAHRRAEAMADGVTLVAPETVFFAYDTIVEADVLIEPNVVFGPGVHVQSGATIRAFSHLEGARVGPGASVGPFARLRPGAVLEKDAYVGNFVEVKKVRMGEGAKASHLSYLGDGTVGAGANIGAGTIFCNYDGYFKYETKIGAGAFIGSNSALVAPVSIGKGAYVGSGSVITKDVPDDALAVGRGRQIEREGWAAAFHEKMAEKKAKTKKG
ncbi:MAG: bifunctional UDP-N-acetylglucosamine diphosphorylase/glucosamine-1-phosphate N-acetyltransferase GlmU [Hyphomonas sp.]|nr:bifunctional UDP-N-acetylglucosamine diphosphorylase/glucosamine-1-phosphate N-acetyltransferase GlmU [Hyphomonas sp.]MCA8903438.1 bifunctional UDP-N-acetylglucosamine diphosphorylase/glucosamine-1-phosphate N-acetyltransferase GlmU [Hyphomonas sp.]MCB9961786.1 bifunctional UDP-N-acetylglucosamine diphosphorylase/glucosamine-1-phosphate N-acetyltransferase GlmU [Hyphomonas sp.]MCB9972719.1 bifunctional UDP-N-acetylglucosamine diphosphorylase/glucosamine-1-phosphate N-acetyltransferase GlmU [H